MSGLEKLTREELIDLVLRQQEMIEALQERIARLESELEEARNWRRCLVRQLGWRCR